MDNQTASPTWKRAVFPLLAVLLLTLTVTSVIYGQSSDGSRVLAGPTSGHFHHDQYRPYMEIDEAGVEVYNTVVSATFENPYNRRGGNFSYGFLLRVNDNRDKPAVRFHVHSSLLWYLSAGTKYYFGPAPSLRVAAYEWNGLTVSLSGNYATLFLNGTQLQTSAGDKRFDLGSNTATGDVWIVNGMTSDSVRDGAITHYDLFTVSTATGTESKVKEIALEKSLLQEEALQGKDSSENRGRIPLE